MTLDLARITALADAATEGPWRSMEEGNQYIDCNYIPTAKLVSAAVVYGIKRPWNPHGFFGGAGHCSAKEFEKARFLSEDAAFIAAARTAVPEMAKEIERLRADMESYREGVRRTIKHNVDERLAALAKVERLRSLLGRAREAVADLSNGEMLGDDGTLDVDALITEIDEAVKP